MGALKAKHIDDAVAALEVTLTDDEAKRLEAPYTPRNDFQGISTPAILHHSMEDALVSAPRLRSSETFFETAALLAKRLGLVCALQAGVGSAGCW